MIEYTLLNVLVLELKIYCGPDKFYQRSKFGQYDEVKNRAPYLFGQFQMVYRIMQVCKIHGRRGEPSLPYILQSRHISIDRLEHTYILQTRHISIPSGTDQINVLIRRGPRIMYYAITNIRNKNYRRLHTYSSFARENVMLRLARTTS